MFSSESFSLSDFWSTYLHFLCLPIPARPHPVFSFLLSLAAAAAAQDSEGKTRILPSTQANGKALSLSFSASAMY